MGQTDHSKRLPGHLAVWRTANLCKHAANWMPAVNAVCGSQRGIASQKGCLYLHRNKPGYVLLQPTSLAPLSRRSRSLQHCKNRWPNSQQASCCQSSVSKRSVPHLGCPPARVMGMSLLRVTPVWYVRAVSSWPK